MAGDIRAILPRLVADENGVGQHEADGLPLRVIGGDLRQADIGPRDV